MNPSVHAYKVGKMPPYTKQEDAKKTKASQAKGPLLSFLSLEQSGNQKRL